MGLLLGVGLGGRWHLLSVRRAGFVGLYFFRRARITGVVAGDSYVAAGGDHVGPDSYSSLDCSTLLREGYEAVAEIFFRGSMAPVRCAFWAFMAVLRCGGDD